MVSFDPPWLYLLLDGILVATSVYCMRATRKVADPVINKYLIADNSAPCGPEYKSS